MTAQKVQSTLILYLADTESNTYVIRPKIVHDQQENITTQ